MNEPRWKHDCTKCKFLGQTIAGGNVNDLYVCDQGMKAITLIARYSDNGPDYYSMAPSFINAADCMAELFVAKALYEESLNVPDVTASSGCVFCDIGLKPTVDGWHKTVTENVKCPLA